MKKFTSYTKLAEHINELLKANPENEMSVEEFWNEFVSMSQTLIDDRSYPSPNAVLGKQRYYATIQCGKSSVVIRCNHRGDKTELYWSSALNGWGGYGLPLNKSAINVLREHLIPFATKKTNTAAKDVKKNKFKEIGIIPNLQKKIKALNPDIYLKSNNYSITIGIKGIVGYEIKLSEGNKKWLSDKNRDKDIDNLLEWINQFKDFKGYQGKSLATRTGCGLKLSDLFIP